MFEPYKLYVTSGQQLARMMEDKNVNNLIFKISQLDSRIANFHVRGRKSGPQSLLFYNGCGGYGDQIMTWPVVKLLAQMGFEVHVLTEPGNEQCWWGFPWIKSVLTLPMEYEVFKLFTYHCIFEYLSNFDEHPGQLHPVDCMLEKIGIEHLAVAPELKKIEPVFNRTEIGQALQVKKEKTIGIYQLSASQGYRSLAPDQSIFVLQRLANTFPHVHWIALFDEFNPKEYAEMAKELKLDNVEVKCFEYIRALWALAKMSAVIVSPDSMMVHVAGVLDIPCVSYWGATSPQSRMKYYTNQTTVFHRESCPLSPCHFSGATFPKYCPPSEKRTKCDAMMSISADEIVEACRKVLTGVNKSKTDDKDSGNSDTAKSIGSVGRVGRPENSIPLPTS